MLIHSTPTFVVLINYSMQGNQTIESMILVEEATTKNSIFIYNGQAPPSELSGFIQGSIPTLAISGSHKFLFFLTM